ncbi:hypothetical protein [Reyranella sp.]|uniref:hypothetical protein n=1 Tax=Reyranella sp. TaxID=1929291 RepID=UPI003D0EFC07
MTGFVAIVDPAELAIRLCEANYRLKRPTPDARHALAAMDEDVREGWLRSAKAAADYFAEILNAAERTH